MRIIAGCFKKKKLVSPKTIYTRPTLDSVKEAIFSIIGDDINGTSVLDLFSGTGNLALEAISRGAKFAWLNDNDKNAISVICENVSLTDCTKCVKITMKDYAKCLKQIVKEKVKFDYIFLDPPYDTEFIEDILQQIITNDILSLDGCIVVERDKKKPFLKKIEGLQLVKEKMYGRVEIKIFKLED